MAAFRNVDREAPRFALGDEPLRRIEAREIVKQPRQACPSRIGAMPLREEIGTTRNPHAMRVPVLLSQIFFNAP
jgi:hypothetical protein